jgi:hypothetical protein
MTLMTSQRRLVSELPGGLSLSLMGGGDILSSPAPVSALRLPQNQ